MEQLRDHLGIEKWLLFGLSWGSVLSITYALRHPQRVSELIVTAVATGRHAEIEWLIRGFGAADDWCAWEDALATIPPGRDVQHEPWEPRFQLAFARLVPHQETLGL
jgi:proline iminopeptidase